MKYYTLQLNAKLHAIDLEILYDKPIKAALEKAKMGWVNCVGIKRMKSREVEFCNVEIVLDNDVPVESLIKIVEDIGVPKGSLLHSEEEDVPCGTLEGYAIYINSISLPNEVYKTCKVNVVADRLSKLMKGCGAFYSYWEGSEDTALYFYGTSFARMKQEAQPFVDQYPLCQQCKIIQIA